MQFLASSRHPRDTETDNFLLQHSVDKNPCSCICHENSLFSFILDMPSPPPSGLIWLPAFVEHSTLNVISFLPFFFSFSHLRNVESIDQKWCFAVPKSYRATFIIFGFLISELKWVMFGHWISNGEKCSGQPASQLHEFSTWWELTAHFHLPLSWKKKTNSKIWKMPLIMQGLHYPVFRCPRSGKNNAGFNLLTDMPTECLEEITFVNKSHGNDKRKHTKKRNLHKEME